MLRFKVSGYTGGKSPEPLVAAFDNLIVAGWTGRDTTALERHIHELAALGVPRPSSVPVFYRTSATLLTQTHSLQVLGPHTSGEVEPVLFGLADGTYLGLGSDHTDRNAETMGVALSKQLCGKVIGEELWRLGDVASHWDQLVIRSHVTVDGSSVLYQEGPLAHMRSPAELLRLYDGSAAMKPNAAMFCGTLAAIGGIRPAARFAMELEDPVLGRRMAHAYDIAPLPVVV